MGQSRGTTLRSRWCEFSPDGKFFAVTGWDGVVNVWEIATDTRIQRLGGPGGGILSLAFSPDGKHLLAGTELGLLRVWDVASWREQKTFRPHQGNIRCIAFSPDGKLMATASFDKSVKLMDAP